MKPHFFYQIDLRIKKWVTQTRPWSDLELLLTVLIGLAIPILAAFIQSAWARNSALIQGDDWVLMLIITMSAPAVISVGVLLSLLRFPVLQRLAAALLLCGWGYLYASSSVTCR